MGFYSFITQDTGRSISNRYSQRTPFKVYMYDNEGMMYSEHNYEGYGNFGAVDYFDLMASMNNLPDRYAAIIAYTEQHDGLLYPNLVESAEWEWRNERPERCTSQGYFYE